MLTAKKAKSMRYKFRHIGRRKKGLFCHRIYLVQCLGENGHAGQFKIITQTFGSFGCGVVWDAGKAGAKTAFEWIFASR